MSVENTDSKVNSVTAMLIVLSCLCFIAATCIGLVASVVVAFPDLSFPGASFAKLRPLHTFLSFSGILSGMIALLNAIIVSGKSQVNKSIHNSGIQFGLLFLFVLAGTVSLALGYGSGREYFSWPPILSVFLISTTVITAYKLFAHSTELSKRSPEGFWLIGAGILLVVSGLIESHFWVLPTIANNAIKDLAIQWHGLDTFIAGNSAVLYGCAIYMVQKQPKAQRSSLLFTIAALGLLLSFGHHHYASGQPLLFKILAFCASMLATVSLVRRTKLLIEERRNKNTFLEPTAPLFNAVEIWTLVSIISGVLFAIPQVNIYVHGTYAIVIHSMGSMIGINLMIILAGGFKFSPDKGAQSANVILLGTRLINYSLAAMWLILGAGGLAKGIFRIDTDYLVFQPKIQSFLVFFPIIGLCLLVGIGLMCMQLIQLYRPNKKEMVKSYYLSTE